METFALYLIKSTVWLTGFFLIYILFLRNERFFVLNRAFLVSGILGSILFPLFTWHYTVVFPVTPTIEVLEPQIQGVTAFHESFPVQTLLLYVYLSGAIFLIFRMLKQTFTVLKVIRKSECHHFNSVKLIRTDRYPASFSFFSFVFVNPSTDEPETNEIVNHEQEHIRQQHWIDLLLFEIMHTMHWFNPVSWLYGRLIRQNHEYLADERALQRSSNPAIYRAALLNQMFGAPVISLANSFNYSLNKKRFNMMKQKTYSPVRKLKLLLVLPLIAGVFYAFATPEYKFLQAEGNTEAANLPQNTKTVKGKVITEDGTPLKGTSIVVSGSTIGTMPDDNGNFKLEVPDDSPIVFSFVGFKTVKVKPDFENEMTITMKTEVVSIDAIGNDISAPMEIPGTSLIIIDGKEATKEKMDQIDPGRIEKVDVIKGKRAVEKYGEKGKKGVVLVTLKKGATAPSNTPTNIKVTGYAKDQKEKPAPGTIIEKQNGFGTKYYFGKDQPLIVIDGIVSADKKVNDIAPETIEAVKVLKDEFAITKYGEKGKNGVVEITLKKLKEVFIIVEEMPSFPGGVEALKAFVAETLTYPAIALEKGIQGQVYVSFVVAEDGSVTNAKVERGVDPSLDKEALRIINSMPKWSPGKQRGMPVKVSFSVPIKFNLPPEKISKEKLH